jgi:hypothetical protein
MSGSTTITTRLDALKQVDDALIHEGRFVSTSFLLEIGSDSYLVSIDRGRVVGIDVGPLVMPQWQFALRASADEWHRFWDVTPPPGSNDLFAMLRRKRLRLEGDIHPFMANLLYFKALLAAPRRSAVG